MAVLGSALAVVAAALVVASAAAATLPGRPCSVTRDDRSRCLRVSVPLDRSGALPGTISLRVRVLPPIAPPSGETILALAGGPGQAATPLLEDFAQALGGNVLRSRTLVTFDQRGTGGSGQLTCPSLAPLAGEGSFPPDAIVQSAVAACAQRLGPARAHYASADSAADIEAVRAALGVDRLILYGTSYGTKVALDYAAAYPQHVGALLLDSVVLPEGTDPFERLTLGSVPRVLRTLCARGGCPFTHDVVTDFDALAARLARGPLHGRWIDAHGRAQPAELAQPDLFALLLAGDLDPFERAALPAAVRSALNGDAMPILRLAQTPGDGLDPSSGDSDALDLATSCEDGAVPWAAGTPVGDRAAAVTAALAAIPPAQLAPFGPAGVRALGEADLCRAWPEAPVAQAHGPLPAVPTLILSGNEDLRTPRAEALQLAARIPGARVIEVPQAGHSALGADPLDCASQAVTAFLEHLVPRDCTAPRSRDIPPSPLAPASLRDVPPAHGLPLRAGRTLTAALVTFAVMGRELIIEALPQLIGGQADVRIGGLRGGSVEATRRALVMHRYSYVPGVTISGRLAVDGRARALTLHVGGAAAARGWVRFGRRGFVGRLGGRRFHVGDGAFRGLDVAAWGLRRGRVWRGWLRAARVRSAHHCRSC